VVNGGPRLLPAIDAAAEGFDHPGDVTFWYGFGLRRNPRTMAGVTRDGRLLLVAVDGRAPGYSAGLSFAEEAAVMRALGARGAVNLDGGGSTTMTVRGTVVTRPSDATGERPLGDAILALP
jgi:exopolysaccharide biosynthesis protein